MANTGTVTGKFVGVDGTTAAAGTIILQPAPEWILDATHSQTIVPSQKVITLDGTGSLSTTLLATNDTTLNPSGWTWNATILITGAKPRSFSFALPGGTTVDLASASPVAGSVGNAVVVGPAGPNTVPTDTAIATAVGSSTSATTTALAAAYAPAATVGYSDLLPWFAALGGRETKRANVVMIGASVTEGVGITVDQTQAQRLATTLRGRYPTKGLSGGGRGHVGMAASATSTPWTFTSAGSQAASTYDETFNVGANHRVRLLTGAGDAVNYNKATITLSAAITSFDISHTKTAFGGANYGYYKIDGGGAVAFSTNAATPTPELLHISAAATSTIEIGCLTGSMYLDGIVEYNGDENKGIQVHNCGHGGFTAANWNAGFTAGCWAYTLAALSPDLMIISDLGVNDFVTTVGNKTSAQFKTDFLALIANLRTAGISCPIVIAANYKVDYSAYTYVEPWANYVAAMKAIADADSTVAFVDHSARMPSTSSDTLSIISNDHVHPTAKGYGLMADTLMAAIGAR